MLNNDFINYFLGTACDLINSHSNKEDEEEKSTNCSTNTLDKDMSIAMFSNSAVSLNNVCLNEALLKPSEAAVSATKGKVVDEGLLLFPKSVTRAGSEPALSQ